MNHSEAQEKLYDMLDLAPSDIHRREFQAHIDACPRCREDFETARQLRGAYRSLPDREVPQGFYERLYERLDDEIALEDEVKVTLFDRLIGKYVDRFSDFFGLNRRLGFTMASVLTVAVVLLIILLIYQVPMQQAKAPGLTLAYGDAPVSLYDEKDHQWKANSTSRKLKKGDTLKTDTAKIVVALDADNSVRLGPKTQVRLVTLDVKKDLVSGTFHLNKGRVWIDEKKTAVLAVETEHYLVKPLGTEYEVVREDDGKVTVSCYEGEVEVYIKASNKSVNLSEGEQFISNPNLKKNRRKIEKIDAGSVEKDTWYQWNRKVAVEKPPVPGVEIAPPEMQAEPPPPPPWMRQRRRPPPPLFVPDSPEEWERFIERRRQWRESRRAEFEGPPAPGVPTSPPNKPGSKPGGIEIIPPTGVPDNPSRPGMDPVPAKGGFFAGIHPEKRRMIIRRLKNQGKLPADYPDDADSLPPAVEQELIRKIRENRNRQQVKPQQPGPASTSVHPVHPAVPGEPGVAKTPLDKPGSVAPPVQPPENWQPPPGALQPGPGRPPERPAFNTLPPEMRKRIITNLKARGILSSDFPDDADDLPEDVKQYLKKRERPPGPGGSNQPPPPGTQEYDTGPPGSGGQSVPPQLQNPE